MDRALPLAALGVQNRRPSVEGKVGELQASPTLRSVDRVFVMLAELTEMVFILPPNIAVQAFGRATEVENAQWQSADTQGFFSQQLGDRY